MENKIKEAIEKIIKSDKRVKIFAAIGLVGIILILLSEILPSSAASKPKRSSDSLYADYIASLETQTADLLSSIDGAGKCKVMITLKDTNESVFAKNSQENKSDSSYSKSYEYVLYDGSDGDEPILVKQYFPKVQGIAIVCEGADNTVVRENIINSVSSLFDISVSKISVSKIKG